MKKLLAALTLLPASAWAHTDGSQLHSWGAGLLHPLLGWDHLLALLAAGLCAANVNRQNARQLQLGMMLALSVGIIGASYLPAVNLEPAIAASLVVAGGWVCLVRSVPWMLSVAVLAAALFSHGWVHGEELPATAPFAFTAGLLVASAAIITTSAGAARLLAAKASRLSCYLMGGAVAVTGLIMSI